MRTVIIMASGFLLLAIALILVRRFRTSSTTTTIWPISAFIGIWFAVAAVNLWIGVEQAGNGFTEELPIFLVIFLVPVAAALVLQRKFLT